MFKEKMKMRKQGKVILWPVYFDRSRTKKEGRRVPKSLAVPNPRLKELQMAAEMLGLKPEVKADAAHPAIPWLKTGRLWVRKDKSKMNTLIRVADELARVRQLEKK